MVLKTLSFLIIITINLIVNSTLVYGQTAADTARFKQLIVDGDKYITLAKYEESRLSFMQARDFGDSLQSVSMFYKAEGKLIELLWRQGKREESKVQAHKVLKRIRRELGEDTFHQAAIMVEIANANLLSGLYDSSKYYYENAIEIYRKVEGYPLYNLAIAYGNFAILNGRMGEVVIEGKNLKTSYELMKTLYDEDDPKMVPTLNNLASNYANRNLLSESIAFQERSVQILEKNNVKGSLRSRVLSNLGVILSNNGETKKAMGYLLQGLKEQIELYGEDHIQNVSFYNRLADNLEKQELYDSSRVYLLKAYRFLEDIKISNPELASSVLASLVRVERGMGNYDQAVAYAMESVHVLEALQVSNNYNLILAFYELGITYLKFNKLGEAIHYLKKAIDLCREHYGSEEPGLMSYYTALGTAYRKQQNFDESLKYLQLALQINHPEWEPESINDNPDIETAMVESSYVFYLSEKAKTLMAKYQESKEVSDLKSLLSLHNLMDQGIRRIRKTFFMLDDKRGFQEIVDEIYESAIAYNLIASKELNDPAYLERCFYFSEASKTGILSDALNTMSAKKWSGLPTKLIEFEKSSKANRATYQAKYYQEKVKEDKDSAKIARYESLIFNSNRILDSLLTIFEKEYPVYHQINYSDHITSVKEVKNQLSENESLIEYFIGDSVGYAFYISQDQFRVKHLPAKAEISNLSNHFRKGLDSFQLDKAIDSNDDFFKTSHQLYQMLIAIYDQELIKDQISKLTIVPDAELGYIPFDILLTKPATDQVNELSYLIADLSISYGYSAQNLNIKLHKRKQNLRYLSFAPSYLATDQQKSLVGRGNQNVIVPLYWNEEEATLPGQYMKGQSILGALATETTFKQKAREATVLHMAMHAFVDDTDPMNSRLVFYQDADSVEDGSLHTFELYNMQLNAELAVLSACETGYGKIVKGEGIVSLARGFAYAGVPSVVMSHWQVDDQSTSVLMKYFYHFLSEGQAKSDALRAAKIAYLQEAKGALKHPFYWGAFVVIGDDSPIVSKSNLIYYLLAAGILLIALIYVLAKRKTAADRK